MWIIIIDVWYTEPKPICVKSGTLCLLEGIDGLRILDSYGANKELDIYYRRGGAGRNF